MLGTTSNIIVFEQKCTVYLKKRGTLWKSEATGVTSMARKTPKNKNSKCVAFYRVSTDRQAKSGLGLEAQKEAVENYAKAHGLTIVHEFTEAGISGKLDLEQRHGLLEAVQAAKESKVGTFLFYKLCRVSRDSLTSMMVKRDLERSGVSLVSTSGEGTQTDSPADRLLSTILMGVYDYEGSIISLRVKAALAAKKARSAIDGTWPCGHPPKGFTVDPEGYLIPDKSFPLVLKAVSFRLEGVSLRKTAQIMGVSQHSVIQRWTNPWMANPEALLSYSDSYEALYAS